MNTQKAQQKLELQQKLVEQGQWQTCLNCENQDSVDNVPSAICCKLAPQYEIPLQTIVVGCPMWVDRIPF